MVACLFFLSLRAFAQTPLQKVTISYSSTGMPSIQLFIAREKNFFREEGIEPLLVRTSANTAIAAGIAGELDALGSIGSAVRAIQRGAPLRVLAVDLRRPIFWLVARPEYRSVKDLKGKVLGIATINGSQHTVAKKMLSLGGIDSDKDLTFVQVGDESAQLQALVGNSIQVSALTPPRGGRFCSAGAPAEGALAGSFRHPRGKNEIEATADPRREHLPARGALDGAVAASAP